MLRGIGLEVHRIKPSCSTRQIVSSLDQFNIDWVLDVGANQGQFASTIRSAGYKGNIVSFEPLTDAHTALLRASTDDSKWHIHPRCALGDQNGEIEINIAGNSVSSSILPMLQTHLNSAPESLYQGKETVTIYTLDSVARRYLKTAHAPFLKIDTQGYEWQVLEGAREILPQIQGVLLELSLLPLYEGQHLWREIIDWLEAEGFILWALLPVFIDPVAGRTLQFDGLFYRMKD